MGCLQEKIYVTVTCVTGWKRPQTGCPTPPIFLLSKIWPPGCDRIKGQHRTPSIYVTAREVEKFFPPTHCHWQLSSQKLQNIKIRGNFKIYLGVKIYINQSRKVLKFPPLRERGGELRKPLVWGGGGACIWGSLSWWWPGFKMKKIVNTDDWIKRKTTCRQCCGAGPFLTGSGYFFFTGSGSFSYKNRLKSSKKCFCLHIFTPAPAPTKKYRLRLRNTACRDPRFPKLPVRCNCSH